LPDLPGPVGTILQAFEKPGIITPFPTIKGLRTNTKITASEAGIVTVGVVEIKPF